MKKTFTVLLFIFAGIGLLFTGVFIAMKLGLTNNWGSIDKQQNQFLNDSTPLYDTTIWEKSPEWETFKTAILKDKILLENISKQTGINPRLIMAICAVEQLRLFYSNRAVYEEIFSPLKILGVQSQFSWGVMGIKRETAIEIEKRDESGLLKFSTLDPETERFERLTAEKDRSWSYLYTAIFLKEIQKEWKDAGFNIDDKPGILATLYNLGFTKSIPKENPQIGGAVIDFGGQEYTFGALAHDIYYSDELIIEFPR